MAIGEKFSTRELDQADKEWIASSLKSLKFMIDWRSDTKNENYHTAEVLDEYFDKCFKDFELGKLGRDVIASAFGCGLGECLINTYGFKWLIYSDEYGTDLSLYHVEKNLFAFPISSTHKRFDSDDAATFDGIVSAFKEKF